MKKAIRNVRGDRICDAIVDERTDRIKIVTKEGRYTKEIDLEELLRAIEYMTLVQKTK